MASIVRILVDGSSSADSKRCTVFQLKLAFSANCAADHFSSARAALICALVIMTYFMLFVG